MSPPQTFDSRLSTHQQGSDVQAWDAADRALLTAIPATARDLVLIGARWGALVASRPEVFRSALVDSAAGRHAVAQNHALLGHPAPHAAIFADVHAASAIGADHAGVVVRAPPSVALFDWHLSRARELAPVGAPVWIAGLASTWSRGHTRALATHLGADVVCRGVGKARVALASIPTRGATPTTPPTTGAGPDGAALPWSRVASPTGFSLYSLPGVFSHGAVDPGARAMIAALPARFSGLRVVDLGCGNGILGAEAAQRGAASVVFTDDSARALASARRTWAALVHAEAPAAQATFQHADAGQDLPSGEADLILCNPPFHQGKAQILHVVDAMLLASRRLLRQGGALLLVGNRHLHHESRAPSVLAGVRVIRDDGRFSVLRARR